MSEHVVPVEIPRTQLNDGKSMPVLGLGVYKMDDDEAQAAVFAAIRAGYRHIDTAVLYYNETGVGRGIRDAIDAGLVTRDELFVTTKVWNDMQSAENTRKSLNESLERMQLEYIDLALVHWPAPQLGTYLECWQALLDAKADGLIRSAGVSNFYPEVLDELEAATGERPVCNQIEMHPEWSQPEQRADDARRGIVSVAWSPLGRGAQFELSPIPELAEKYDKTPAQIVLRWHIQLGNVVIPKTKTPSRMVENVSVFDFALTDEEVAAITALDSPEGRQGGDPFTFVGA